MPFMIGESRWSSVCPEMGSTESWRRFGSVRTKFDLSRFVMKRRPHLWHALTPNTRASLEYAFQPQVQADCTSLTVSTTPNWTGRRFWRSRDCNIPTLSKPTRSRTWNWTRFSWMLRFTTLESWDPATLRTWPTLRAERRFLIEVCRM